MTTDDVFHKWINQQDWINWKDPKSVQKAFILFGDHVKDEYYKFKVPSINGSLIFAVVFGYKQCEKGNNVQMAVKEWHKLTPEQK